MSTRTLTHMIDTKAIKKIMNIIPDHWIIRELTERDYGIDLMIEIFKINGKDNSEHIKYESSGHICYLQVKGTSKKIIEKKDKDYISFILKKKTLNYVEKFTIPFFLVYVSTHDKESVYFTWIQRYIQNVLNHEKVDWRESKQQNFTIKMPIENSLPANLSKIEIISAQPKYREEYAIFFEKFSAIHSYFTTIDNITLDDEFYNWVISELNEIKRLRTLLNYNYCCVGVDDINRLRDLISKIKEGYTPIDVLKNSDENYYKLKLLLNEGFSRYGIENIDAQMTGTRYY